MASAAVLDLEALLTPIPGDVPSGVDPRADRQPTSVYYKIRGLERSAREAERQAELNGEPPRGDEWRPLVDQIPPILAKQAKDLELATYLTEGLLRIHGVAGLRDGFALINGLIERFWDHLYPAVDEDGLETRLAKFSGLNGGEAPGTLIAPLFRVKVTEGRGEGPYTFFDVRQSVELASMDPERRERRVQAGAVTPEAIERAVAATSPQFFTTLLEDVSQAEQEYFKLSMALDEACGAAAPGSTHIRGALAELREVAERFARQRNPVAASADGSEPATGGSAPSGGAGTSVAVGAIRTRDDAFRLLLQVAEYFRVNEPHSPVSYATERAVRWGRMPLPELMQELIPEEGQRSQVFRLVGIDQGQAPS